MVAEDSRDGTWRRSMRIRTVQDLHGRAFRREGSQILGL